MEEYSAECGGHGCLFLFPAESLSAWQCSTSGGSISKLNAADSFSRCCAPERRQAQNSQNNCRRAGNAGPCTHTTVVAWPVHIIPLYIGDGCQLHRPLLLSWYILQWPSR